MSIGRFVAALLLVASPMRASADDPEVAVARSIADRFSGDAAEGSVDFQRHVVPLLGKLGCNGRACHGSFQGQGDFRLSLFGYDFRMDHEGLLDRLDLDTPAESYAIQKALGHEDHGGGERTTVDDWEYRVLLRWVADGASGVPVAEGVDEKGKPQPVADPDVLVSLTVEPDQIAFADGGESVQLRVIATWDDGTAEDVTPLARFSTNDDQVAEISEDGLVTAAGPGGTHVVVTYDNGVTPVAVMRAMPGEIDPGAFADYDATEIDRAVADRLRTLRIEPSAKADDAAFLRRVSLDIAGTLPTARQVRDFLADTSTDKRARKIDELLETPAYADWWAVWLSDLTGNSEKFQNNMVGGGNLQAKLWHDWLRVRLADNRPYDEIVRGIVMANTRLDGESYADYCERFTGYVRDGSMADSPSLPQYWTRANFRQPEERAIGFAYTFLGLRIQCAQCHKHPFDEWTQEDFTDFQNFFLDTRYGRNPATRDEMDTMLAGLGLDKLKGGNLNRELQKQVNAGKVVPMQELFNLQEQRLEKMRRQAKKRKRAFRPPSRNARVLGGEAVGLADFSDPREPLMNWLTGDARDLFARAAVNRVWARYFGRGIVHPTDDLSLANPPSNEPLMRLLADRFIESGYDLKQLHRTIANSRTYQTSWQPTASNRQDEKHFARALIRRMPAEVAVDAVAIAAASDEVASTYLTDTADRAIAIPDTGSRRGRDRNYALEIFGKSLRETNCDCERTEEPSLLQTIYLRNDRELLATLDRPQGSWIAQVASQWGVSFAPAVADVRGGRTRPENYGERINQFDTSIARLRKAGRTEAVADLKKRKQRFVKRYAALPPHPDSVTPSDPAGGNVSPEQIERAAVDTYLRTLGRLPSEDERIAAVDAVLLTDDPVVGLRDLLWALVNSKEFQVNH